MTDIKRKYHVGSDQKYRDAEFWKGREEKESKNCDTCIYNEVCDDECYQIDESEIEQENKSLKSMFRELYAAPCARTWLEEMQSTIEEMLKE